MRKTTRRHHNGPTIADVAQAAGVSTMTVSRVMNGEGNVREATREAVRAAVAALDYRPNAAARSLAAAGGLRIALLYSNPSAGYLSEFLVGSLDEIARHDVQLVVEKCEPGADDDGVVRRLVDRGIDGLILPPPLCDSSGVHAAVTTTGIPAVAVASGQPPAELMAVSIDDRLAALTMTREILSLGHRRIGFITGDANQTATGRRRDGYCQALADAGLPIDERLIAPGRFTYRSGLDAADRLLGLAEPPTAIFASNDDMAAATVAVGHRRGLDVPGDLTVCGFDDTTLATAIWPKLSTIRQPIADMSRAAVAMLVAAIRGKPAPSPEDARHRLLDFTLVRRESAGPPRGV